MNGGVPLPNLTLHGTFGEMISHTCPLLKMQKDDRTESVSPNLSIASSIILKKGHRYYLLHIYA